ncbi:E3 SUMO-protein ligase KIAA1586-like [Hydra vulgaris]|uniref:E3 SUMO-protein ligase KIAA1586-like n=1 Tax=Hydra vulgaris TaxID=6087 RepID=A0ABM4DM44_HYDVU
MGMKISKEWFNNEVFYYGENRKQQLSSLPNIFRTAYKVAKGNQSFNNFEMEIDLQEINGVEMGRILHSTNACINIVNHIGNEMRKKIIAKVIKSKMELESVTAKGVFVALLECLHSYGMKDEYLKNYLVSVACDGAAVMLGCKSGVFKLITEKFLFVIVWHCANHRLELSLLKIGRISNTRWVSSSFRSVFAVWENYEALVKHFEEAMVDPTRDKNKKSTYAGLKKKITSTEFLMDLGLMCDALQELSELSLDLQERNIDLYKANQKIKALVQHRKFHGVLLHNKNSKNNSAINPNAFYIKLKESIEKRLLADKDLELAQWARILDQNHWPDNINNQVTFRETEIINLSLRLQLNEREMIRGFREYLAGKTS